MSGIQRDEDERRQGSNSGWGTLGVAGAVITGAAALAGGIYMLASGSKTSKQPVVQQGTSNQRQRKTPNSTNNRPDSTDSSVTTLTRGLMNLVSMAANNSSASNFSGKIAQNPPPSNPSITNINSLLADIHVRFIQLKNDDFQLHYRVFDRLFQHLHQKMKDVDPYYRKYSSMVQFAGSHYDNLRIKKPDEFDMDIVIGLPLNISENSSNRAESDIVIEPLSAGFVQLKMGLQFQRLPMRDGAEWLNNKAAFEWKDSSNYLLRSKFLDYFKSIVNKALNTFEKSCDIPLFYVDGVCYSIGKSESGPAVTLFIENRARGFKLDVDLVPALKFPESRWPVNRNYRHIPRECLKGEWLVVGKPNKGAPAHEQTRCWRIALHNQERELMHNSYNLRQAIRLLKKLRDAQGMKKIASYYIKTLFFWEIVERNDKCFWSSNSPAVLFKVMVARLHEALVNQKIPYFWNKNNNLIGNVDAAVLFSYAARLVPLLQVLDAPSNYKMVAKYLLTPEEFKYYNENFLHI